MMRSLQTKPYMLDNREEQCLQLGGEKKEGVAGSFSYQPHITLHGSSVEASTFAWILSMTIPAGFDRFMTNHELPFLNSEPEIDANRYKIEILGSLPE